MVLIHPDEVNHNRHGLRHQYLAYLNCESETGELALAGGGKLALPRTHAKLLPYARAAWSRIRFITKLTMPPAVVPSEQLCRPWRLRTCRL